MILKALTTDKRKREVTKCTYDERARALARCRTELIRERERGGRRSR